MEVVCTIRIKTRYVYGKDARYRLYLDNFLLAERVIPKLQKKDYRIEETIIFNLNPGTHAISIENLHEVAKAVIEDAKIGDQVFSNLNSTDLSFRIN